MEQRWIALKEAVYYASRETLGHPHRKTLDWFWEQGKEIERLLAEKKVSIFGIYRRTLRGARMHLPKSRLMCRGKWELLRTTGDRGEQRNYRVWPTTIMPG